MNVAPGPMLTSTNMSCDEWFIYTVAVPDALCKMPCSEMPFEHKVNCEKLFSEPVG